jgi:rhamnogalacturonan hydrolase
MDPCNSYKLRGTASWLPLFARFLWERLFLPLFSLFCRYHIWYCPKMRISKFLFRAVVLAPTVVVSQLSGKVGPLTSHATKTSKKTCNVLDYGAKADKTTDIGPPLASAHAACKSGGTVVIPSGDYAMNTWVSLTGGSAWALQLDGVIYRTGTAGGNMIFIGNANDFELFSSTGKGAVQGEWFRKQ